MKDSKWFSLYGTLAIVWSIVGFRIVFFVFFVVTFDVFISISALVILYFGVLYLLMRMHKKKKGDSLPWYGRILAIIVVVLVVFNFVLGSLYSTRELTDPSVKQAIGNMRNQIEMYYNENYLSYEGVCKSDKVMRLKTPIEVSGATNYHCDSTTETYRVWARLPEAQVYWCADHKSAGTCNPEDFNNTLETVPN